MANALNENIRRIRLNFGMNQVDFARRLGVTKQCVSNWENDNVVPSVEMLMKIADLFSVSTDCLLGRSEHRFLDVSALTEEQLCHIILIIKDFEKINCLKR